MLGERQDMRRTGQTRIGRAGAVVLAATLLLAGETRAQSSSDGISNLLGNIFCRYDAYYLDGFIFLRILEFGYFGS